MTSYMPFVDSLPEGLSQKEIQQEYGGRNGDRFAAKLRRIEEKITACPGYSP